MDGGRTPPPWEASSTWASQKIPLFLRNSKVQYRLYKSSLFVLNLSHSNPIRAPHLPSNFKITFSTILPSISRSPKWFSFRFPRQNSERISLSEGRYTLSVKLSDFTVWRRTLRKNWVNCAVLTGNSAGLRAVFSSRLSHRKLRSSIRESHSFLGLSADTTVASS